MTSTLRIILLFVLLLTPIAGLAKGKQATDVSAGKILEIEAAYNALSDLTADFTQTTHIKLLDRTVKKDGLFQFKKGGMWRIEYRGKQGKHYVSDGTTLWVYIPGDETTLETFAVNDKTVPKEALSFLSGFARLDKEFEVGECEAFKKTPKGSTALRLVPRKEEAHYQYLDALFGPSDMLSELIVTNRSGNVSHYIFKDLKKNTGLPDSHFSLSSGKATPDTLPE
jgi:outer membrane lipoprotein-sorting protein